MFLMRLNDMCLNHQVSALGKPHLGGQQGNREIPDSAMKKKTGCLGCIGDEILPK